MTRTTNGFVNPFYRSDVRQQGMSCPSWQWHRTGSRWSPVRTLSVAPLWCDLGFVPNSRGNKAAANLRPTAPTSDSLAQDCLSGRAGKTEGIMYLSRYLSRYTLIVTHPSAGAANISAATRASGWNGVGRRGRNQQIHDANVL